MRGVGTNEHKSTSVVCYVRPATCEVATMKALQIMLFLCIILVCTELTVALSRCDSKSKLLLPSAGPKTANVALLQVHKTNGGVDGDSDDISQTAEEKQQESHSAQVLDAKIREKQVDEKETKESKIPKKMNKEEMKLMTKKYAEENPEVQAANAWLQEKYKMTAIRNFFASIPIFFQLYQAML